MHLGHYLHCARRQDDSCVEGRPIFHPGYQIGLPGLSDYRMHPNKVVAASQQKSLRIEMAGPFQWEPPMETAPGNSPRLACQTAFAKDRHTADNESGFPSIPADANVTRAVQSPKEARTVRSEGGKLFVFKGHHGLTLNITKMPPHEAALQILSFIRDTVVRRDEELANEETSPLDSQEPAWA